MKTAAISDDLMQYGAALVCYMVSSVEGEGKIEGYHRVYGGKQVAESVYRGWVARPHGAV